MARLTPEQRRRRETIEGMIRLAEPALNLILAAGERLSRMAEREDQDYYPPQRGHLPPPPGSGDATGPGVRGSSAEVPSTTTSG